MVSYLVQASCFGVEMFYRKIITPQSREGTAREVANDGKKVSYYTQKILAALVERRAYVGTCGNEDGLCWV